MRGRLTAVRGRWLGLTGAAALALALVLGTSSFPDDALGQPAPPGVTVQRVATPTIEVRPSVVPSAPRAEPRLVVVQQPTQLPRTGTGIASDPVPPAVTWGLAGFGVLALGGAAARGLRRTKPEA